MFFPQANVQNVFSDCQNNLLLFSELMLR